MIDQGLQGNPDRGVTSVTLFYDATTKGGSIRVEICMEPNTQFRVMSREISPNPGWLVNKRYQNGQEASCVVKDPVIALGLEDKEVVLIGAGNTEEETYKDMRAY